MSDNKMFASVVLETNVEKPLDYLVPKDLVKTLQKGMIVEVPLRGFLRKGYVFSINDSTEVKNPLPIEKILSDEVINDDLFQLGIWMSSYYCASLHKVFKCMIPTSVRNEIKPKTQVFLSCNKPRAELLATLAELQRSNPKQADVLEILLKTKKGIFLTELLQKTKSSKSPVDTLLKKKILSQTKIITDTSTLLLDEDYFLTSPKKLNDEQQIAFDDISDNIDKNAFNTYLIHGVTGSGKTEIYLQAIQRAIEQNKGAILLVPEIALTSQTIERIRSRFSEKIAVLHHRRSQGERFDAWNKVKSGEAKIVIGARSAIFAPVKNLGLIIVDEEHDSSYKQSEEAPTYHARNLAIMRAKFNSSTVILGSATPALESFYNAKTGKYKLLSLTKRATNAPLPKVYIIDMRREREKNSYGFFSEKLLNGIQERYEKGEQTLLFLNKRGYHRFLICKSCSHVVQCKHCSVSLIFHKNNQSLQCHQCGYQIPPPRKCEACGCEEQLQYKGFGTELVEKSIKAIFPKVRTLRIDRDTTTQKESHETLLKQFRSGKADVLIGTQMIVKGLHFPSVTLVGVLNSDGALNIPDFRSSEIVFSLITQVAGRAGREHAAGEVVIQTYMPDNTTIEIAAKQDFLSFYDMEIENRELFSYPPFAQMAKIILSGKDEEKTQSTAIAFREKLISQLPGSYNIHPVGASGLARVKDRFYFFFLIRGKNIHYVSKMIEKLKSKHRIPSSISLQIDIDPLQTFF